MKTVERIKRYIDPSYMLGILISWLVLSNVIYAYPLMDTISFIIGIVSFFVAVIHIRSVRLNADAIILFFIFVFITISTLINASSGLYQNITMILFMFNFVVLSMEVAKWDRLNRFFDIYTWCITLFSLISIITFAFRIEILFNGTYFGYHWDVLYGVYLNPNTGSMIAFFALAFLWKRFKQNSDKVSLIFMIVNFLYLIFADSRGTYIAMVAFFVAYLFFGNIQKKRYIKSMLNIAVGAALAIMLILMPPMKIIDLAFHQTAYVPGDQQNVASNEQNQNVTQKGESQDTENDMDENKESNDEFQNIDNLSSSRLTLWKAGVEVAKEHLFFGVSKSNQLTALRKFLDPSSKTYNIYAGGVHNGYLDLLVSNGIFAFLLLMLLFIRRMFRFVDRLRKSNVSSNYLFYFSLFLAVLVNNLVETSFFNAIFITCLIFWVTVSNLLSEEQTDQRIQTKPDK